MPGSLAHFVDYSTGTSTEVFDENLIEKINGKNMEEGWSASGRLNRVTQVASGHALASITWKTFITCEQSTE